MEDLINLYKLTFQYIIMNYDHLVLNFEYAENYKSIIEEAENMIKNNLSFNYFKRLQIDYETLDNIPINLQNIRLKYYIQAISLSNSSHFLSLWKNGQATL